MQKHEPSNSNCCVFGEEFCIPFNSWIIVDQSVSQLIVKRYDHTAFSELLRRFSSVDGVPFRVRLLSIASRHTVHTQGLLGSCIVEEFFNLFFITEAEFVGSVRRSSLCRRHHVVHLLSIPMYGIDERGFPQIWINQKTLVSQQFLAELLELSTLFG